MGATGKRHAGGAGTGGELFDVRVTAFSAGPGRTLQGLQDLFGLDREAAQRLVDNVPMVVRRAAPANEANDYVEALRGIGAEVALERPGQSGAGERSVLVKAPPPPPKAKAPPPPPKAALPKVKAAPPPPRDAVPLPRPIVRAPTADLEFDLGTGRGGAEPMGAGAAEPKTTIAGLNKRAGKRDRSEIEFNDGASSARLELDVAAVRPAPERTPDRRLAASGEDQTALEVARPASAAVGDVGSVRLENPEFARGPGPMSRAAVVHKPGAAPLEPVRRKRQLNLLRMLGAVSIAAGGVWLDSSIIYGNANVVSVLAHAVAIYQFGVGLRGMAS